MILEKMESRSLQARVYQRLKRALISGFFEPGQLLLIRELAEQLGTSPMPIRQSLSRLVSEHALEEGDSARSSVRVPDLSIEVFAELRSMRLLVESEAAGLAAKNATKQDITKLRRLNNLIDRAVSTGDETASILANCDFHFTLYELAGSKTLLRVIQSLWLQSGPYFRLLVKRYFSAADDPSVYRNNHDLILDAVSRNDEQAARAALRADIDQAAEFFLKISADDFGKKRADIEGSGHIGIHPLALMGGEVGDTRSRRDRLP